MDYFCKACSYHGKASAAGGECPACGSFDLVVPRPAGEQAEESAPARWRMVVLVGLWGYFLLLILWKLLS